jgi:hypothetical protein
VCIAAGAVLLVLLGATGAAVAQQDDVLTAEVVSAEPIELGSDGSGSLSLLVTNKGAVPLEVSFSLLTTDDTAAPEIIRVEPGDGLGVTVDPYQVLRVEIVLAATGPFSGRLLMTASDAGPAMIAIEVVEKESDEGQNAATPVLFGFVLGLLYLLVALISGTGKSGRGLGREMVVDAPYDFGKSWATTLTTIGALAGTVLGGSVLGASIGGFSKAALLVNEIVLGGIALLGPLAIKAVATAIKGGKTAIPVWGFVTAATFTVWAVGGQVFLLHLLANEGLSGAQALGLHFILAIADVLLVVYVIRSTNGAFKPDDDDGGKLQTLVNRPSTGVL